MSKSRSELFRKAILVTIGATAMTVEKINSVIDELVDRGEMSEQQAKSFKEEVKEKTQAEKEGLEKRISDATHKAISKVLSEIGVATVKDLERLEKRLNAKIEGKEYVEEVTCCKEKHHADCECEDCLDDKKQDHPSGCHCEDCIDT